VEYLFSLLFHSYIIGALCRSNFLTPMFGVCFTFQYVSLVINTFLVSLFIYILFVHMTDVNVGEIIILGRISYFINRRTGPTSNLTYLCICVAESASENNCLNVK